MDMSFCKLQEIVKDREAWRAVVHGVAKNWSWLSNWTPTTNDLSEDILQDQAIRCTYDKAETS